MVWNLYFFTLTHGFSLCCINFINPVHISLLNPSQEITDLDLIIMLKHLAISWLAEWLLSSLEGLSSMEWGRMCELLKTKNHVQGSLPHTVLLLLNLQVLLSESWLVGWFISYLALPFIFHFICTSHTLHCTWDAIIPFAWIISMDRNNHAEMHLYKVNLDKVIIFCNWWKWW